MMTEQLEQKPESGDQAVIGPEAQAAKIAALAGGDVDAPKTEAQLRSQLLRGAGSWQAASLEQRQLHNEALKALEIKNDEVLKMCSENPDLQAILEQGAKEYRKEEYNTPPSRRIIRTEEWQKEEFENRAMQAGIMAVKHHLLMQGVLDSGYIKKEEAA